MPETFQEIIDNPAMEKALSHLETLLRYSNKPLIEIDMNGIIFTTGQLYKVDQYDLRYSFFNIHNCSVEDWYKDPIKRDAKPISKTALKERLMNKCLNNIDEQISTARDVAHVKQIIIQNARRSGLPIEEVRTSWYIHYHESPEAYYSSVKLQRNTVTQVTSDDEDSEYYAAYYNAYYHSGVGTPSKQELAWKRLKELVIYVNTFGPDQKVILKSENFKIDQS